MILVCGGGGVAVQTWQRQRAAQASPKLADTTKVERGAILVQVVETGAVDAARVVELKSRAAGRLAKLLKEEGDKVVSGELIALIDPTETRLQVEQNSAQLRGANSAVARQDIEIRQRRVLAQTNLQKARVRLAQLERETAVQPTLTRTGVEGAESALQAAIQQRDQLVKNTQPNERTSVEAELEQAQLNLDTATRELQRQEELLRQDFVSAREVDNQRLQVDLAKSRRDAARSRKDRLANQQANEVRQAEERIRQARADLARARANGVQDDSKRRELEQARIAVREAEAQLSDVDALIAGRAQAQSQVDQLAISLRDSQRQLNETEIRAPFAGVITRKLVQEGELVASLSSFSSGTPIVRLEDRSSMLVKMNVNEIDVAKLRIGMAAEVTLDALPTSSFRGEVSKIAPARAQPGQGSNDNVVRYEVEVRLDEVTEAIKSGMTAKCTMKVVDRNNVLRIPVDYLIRDGRDRFVLVLPEKPKSTDKGTRQKVTVGAESASYVEIVSGVQEGQLLKRPPFSGPERAGMVGVREE